jgi:hypothetical protein
MKPLLLWLGVCDPGGLPKTGLAEASYTLGLLLILVLEFFFLFEFVFFVVVEVFVLIV